MLTPATTILSLEEVQGDLAASLNDAVRAVRAASAAAVALVDRVAGVEQISSQQLFLGARAMVRVDLVVGTKLVEHHILQAGAALTLAVAVALAAASRVELVARNGDSFADDRLLNESEADRDDLLVLRVPDADRVLFEV